MRKQHGLLAGLAAAAIALVGCTPSSGPSDGDEVVGETVQIGQAGTDVTVGLTYVPNVQFSPIYVAAADDIFQASGIAVSVRHHGPDEGLFTALVAGEEDVTIATGDEVLQARAAGLDVVSIGSYYNKYPVVIIVPADSPAETVEDLAGMKVGLPGEFGSNWFGLLAALKEADMTTSDIEVVSVGFTQASALANGQVDAVVGFVNSDAVQLEQMGVPIRIIPLAPTPVPLVGASIVTTNEWIDKDPEAAWAVVGSIVAGMDRVIANPQHALELTADWDASLKDPHIRRNATHMLEATIELWAGPDGQASAIQDLETWKQMAPFLAAVLGVDEDAMDESTAVTNQYAEQVD